MYGVPTYSRWTEPNNEDGVFPHTAAVMYYTCTWSDPVVQIPYHGNGTNNEEGDSNQSTPAPKIRFSIIHIRGIPQKTS